MNNDCRVCHRLDVYNIAAIVQYAHETCGHEGLEPTPEAVASEALRFLTACIVFAPDYARMVADWYVEPHEITDQSEQRMRLIIEQLNANAERMRGQAR